MVFKAAVLLQKVPKSAVQYYVVCSDNNIELCLPSPSNQSFYRKITGYGMGIGDHRVGQGRKGVMGKQNSYI